MPSKKMNFSLKSLSSEPFVPKLYTVFKEGYSFNDLGKDLISGVTVGIVALPLAMAFAIASGVTPQVGLYTAIVAGIIIATLGGSRFQVTGPTGAFVIIIADIVARHGYEGLLITTFMAGVILLIAGFCRLGSLIKFIPYPVTTGFTAGIAVLIFSTQMNDFLGLKLDNVPSGFFAKWEAYLLNIPNLDPKILGMSFLLLAIMLIVRKYKPKIPSPVIGVFLGGLLVWLFGLPIETIGSKFGAMPSTLPTFNFISFDIDQVRMLLPDAITIALLAGIESLLTCVVADGMTGDRHYSNIELVAQGVGNLACSCMGGMPATGAIARTATNIGSGAVSPVSAIIHSITVLLFVLWLSGLTATIPLSALAAVLVIISWGMFDLRSIRRIFKGPKSDWSVMILTFGLTVVVDLTVAVYTGVILSSLLFMRRMSEVTKVVSIDSNFEGNIQARELPDAVKIFIFNGPFFFGMTDRFQRMLDSEGKKNKVYILHFANVNSFDASALNVLESFLNQRIEGYKVIISDPDPNTKRTLNRMGLLRSVGAHNVCRNLDCAVARAKEIIKNEMISE